ncbi:hypothetical protein GLOTRDRAFT_134732 [Gloeophyllum trabeum ATCC 11539]|uniref:Uncharacterized protein n=1 Tax=Gloeophyllum trabeum (strain ATCC 11539 / FP-39264 / Madison 617) TaxID=670483 RepID=S7R5N7_GLOTA|nr:uncharacterized protein GLOTRDRAFT_134732 [Gloeophyllum trabeum ATCC 11539]EPQ49695.1 hypothetical protein GLOTRDRAFT_134732 [Gloeophyllum trabeum ATCC 11539]
MIFKIIVYNYYITQPPSPFPLSPTDLPPYTGLARSPTWLPAGLRCRQAKGGLVLS